MARIVFNRIRIANKLGKSLKQSRYEHLAYNAANLREKVAESEAMKMFDEHEVTQEILAGPTAQSNSSYGNIFSFIGFNRGTNPTSELRRYLQDNMELLPHPNFIQNKENVIYQFKVKSPDLQGIYDNALFATPDHWSNKSWPELIEKGIDNFSYYVFRLGGFAGKSRSGTGLQRKNPREWLTVEDSALGIPYLSEIIEKFRSYFKSR